VSQAKGEVRKIRVGVLFGGRSGEHEVSLTSAKGIIDAMDKEKYEIVPIGITKQVNGWPAVTFTGA
jgi:D-alanine-D-alanine ligase